MNPRDPLGTGFVWFTSVVEDMDSKERSKKYLFARKLKGNPNYPEFQILESIWIGLVGFNTKKKVGMNHLWKVLEMKGLLATYLHSYSQQSWVFSKELWIRWGNNILVPILETKGNYRKKETDKFRERKGREREGGRERCLWEVFLSLNFGKIILRTKNKHNSTITYWNIHT